MMFMGLFSFIYLSLVCVFLSLSGPLSMGITMMGMVLNSCCMMSALSVSVWYSYILFLVFLGGVLVLFIYISSLAPNTKFSGPVSLVGVLLGALVVSMVLLFDFSFAESSVVKSFLYSNNSSIEKLFFLYGGSTLFLICYLLLALLVVVELVTEESGALRKG